MARPITTDLRRESIDFLSVGGQFAGKLSASNSCDGETVPLRRIFGSQPDQDSKKDGEFTGQNGRRAKDDKRPGYSAGKTWGFRSEEYRRIQNYCYRFLEMPRGIGEIMYHALLFFLVIASLVLTVLSTVKTRDKNYEQILQTPILAVEIILIVIFVIEYIIRLWAAGCRSAYVGIKGRFWFALKLYSIIDMIVIISSVVAVSLASNVSTSPIRLLRFLPLLRVLRFDRQGGTWKLLGSVIYVHRQELLTTFYLGFISLICASFVLYMVEKDSNSDFESWPSSFWWGIVTLTTVGYGDAVPVTWYGKFCAALFALCGISFFALPAGILGSGFALKVTQQQRQKHFHRRRRPAAILLQSYWRLFCADLDSKSVATWLPSIYYNRQQHLLKTVMEKTGTTGTALEDDSPQLSDTQRKRKRSIWSKQKGLRRESYDVRSSRSESLLTGIIDRKTSIASTLDHDYYFDENALLALQQDGERPCIALTNAQKLAIRLIRILKLRVAIRKFKEARRPYDVKDVIEQYSAGHVEMLARVKNLQAKMDKVFNNTIEGGDHENSGKQGISHRLTRVEHQVTVIDSKLELVLQMLQNIQNTRGSPSGGSHSYDLHFRGNGDGVSSRRSSVSRAHSDPLDVRTQMSSEPHGVTTHVVRNSDIPCVTLSDPESFPSSGSRPVSLSSVHSQSLHGSVSGGEQHQNLDQIDNVYLSDPGALSAPLLSRILVNDKRQLSDVTEESLGDSKETVGGLTPPGPISQQNSTASDSDPVPGGTDSSLTEQKDEEPVWEKQEPGSEFRRRKRSLLNLGETETKLPDDKEKWDAKNPSDTGQEKDPETWNSAELYTRTSERKDSLTEEKGSSQRGAQGQSDDDPRAVEEGHFDSSVRSAPTRMSAKRRPLVKSNPVEV